MFGSAKSPLDWLRYLHEAARSQIEVWKQFSRFSSLCRPHDFCAPSCNLTCDSFWRFTPARDPLQRFESNSRFPRWLAQSHTDRLWTQWANYGWCNKHCRRYHARHVPRNASVVHQNSDRLARQNRSHERVCGVRSRFLHNRSSHFRAHWSYSCQILPTIANLVPGPTVERLFLAANGLDILSWTIWAQFWANSRISIIHIGTNRAWCLSAACIERSHFGPPLFATSSRCSGQLGAGFLKQQLRLRVVRNYGTHWKRLHQRVAQVDWTLERRADRWRWWWRRIDGWLTATLWRFLTLKLSL